MSYRVNIHRNMTETAVNNAPSLRQIMGKRREGMEKTKIEKGKRRVINGDVTEKVAKIKPTKIQKDVENEKGTELTKLSQPWPQPPHHRAWS